MDFDQKVDFSRFGKLFQEKLVHIMYQDRPFCDQFREVLDVNFLELKHLQVFVLKLLDYKDKYSTHPSDSAMITMLRADLDDENEATQKMVREYFARCLANKAIEDEMFIKETALDFCKKQKLKTALIKSAQLLQKASFDEISSLIGEALKLGMNNDIGYDYIKDFEQRYMMKSRNPITTGWDLVDKLTKGGHGKGELGVVIAPTGAGKSMALVHLGAAALKAGKSIVHYTMELSETVIGTRYDACLTNYSLKDLFTFKEDVFDEVKKYKDKLIIKEYPTKKATTATLRNHLEKLKNINHDVDLVIVDYGDLLRPIKVYREKRMELETIYEDLRGIAQELECPVWTASQTNRSGLNAEVITMESIAEAFSKCYVADLILTLSRTIEDKNANGGRVFIAKNRNGPDGLVYPVFMDTASIRIEVLEPTGETVEDIKENALKKQKNRIKELYKDFKKNGGDKDEE